MENKVQQPATAAEPIQQKPWFRSEDINTDPAHPTQNNAPAITAQIASAIATLQTPGKVLRVKLLLSKQGPAKYRIKVLSNSGEIHILYIDAASGALMTPNSDQPGGQP